jgi:hypothetical protein
MTEQPRPDAERTVVRRAVTPASPDRPRWYRRIWSNLNLNGPVPARVRPAIGEWGPVGLPSTKQKKRVRWLTPVVFLVVLTALVLLGWFFWTAFR